MNSTSSSDRLIHWAHLFLKARERFLKAHETPRAGQDHAHLMLSSTAVGKGSRLSISSAADLFFWPSRRGMETSCSRDRIQRRPSRVDACQFGSAGNLTDVENRWESKYGVNADGAVLVRPD